ncbi:SagB/ThcOx family dehydrogenase [[Eubacterium] cellulosolvens]
MERKKIGIIFISSIIFISILLQIAPWYKDMAQITTSYTFISNELISLPQPSYESNFSIEEALLKRRSTREYSVGLLTLDEISQILWAAQGITHEERLRTAPSAGGLYPLELYVVVGDVEGLETGIYHYVPMENNLLKTVEGDKRSDIADAALNQDWIEKAAINIIITAVYERTTEKYGERGIRYVHMEVGHTAQNICLQATALNLGVVTVGAFNDDKVVQLLYLKQDEKPLYIIPIGRIN